MGVAFDGSLNQNSDRNVVAISGGRDSASYMADFKSHIRYEINLSRVHDVCSNEMIK